MEIERKRKLISVDREEYELEKCLLTDIIYTAVLPRNEEEAER